MEFFGALYLICSRMEGVKVGIFFRNVVYCGRKLQRYLLQVPCTDLCTFAFRIMLIKSLLSTQFSSGLKM